MHQWTVHEVYIKCIQEEFLLNDDISVFNKHLTCIFMDSDEIKKKFLFFQYRLLIYTSMDCVGSIYYTSTRDFFVK